MSEQTNAGDAPVAVPLVLPGGTRVTVPPELVPVLSQPEPAHRLDTPEPEPEPQPEPEKKTRR